MHTAATLASCFVAACWVMVAGCSGPDDTGNTFATGMLTSAGEDESTEDGAEPPDGFLASCDTRDSNGGNAGQCRDWTGDDPMMIASTCTLDLEGEYSDTDACSDDMRVGTCTLEVAAGLTELVRYYAPDHSAAAGEALCSAYDGVWQADA